MQKINPALSTLILAAFWLLTAPLWGSQLLTQFPHEMFAKGPGQADLIEVFRNGTISEVHLMYAKAKKGDFASAGAAGHAMVRLRMTGGEDLVLHRRGGQSIIFSGLQETAFFYGQERDRSVLSLPLAINLTKHEHRDKAANLRADIESLLSESPSPWSFNYNCVSLAIRLLKPLFPSDNSLGWNFILTPNQLWNKIVAMNQLSKEAPEGGGYSLSPNQIPKLFSHADAGIDWIISNHRKLFYDSEDELAYYAGLFPFFYDQAEDKQAAFQLVSPWNQDEAPDFLKNFLVRTAATHGITVQSYLKYQGLLFPTRSEDIKTSESQLIGMAIRELGEPTGREISGLLENLQHEPNSGREQKLESVRNLLTLTEYEKSAKTREAFRDYVSSLEKYLVFKDHRSDWLLIKNLLDVSRLKAMGAHSTMISTVKKFLSLHKPTSINSSHSPFQKHPVLRALMLASQAPLIGTGKTAETEDTELYQWLETYVYILGCFDLLGNRYGPATKISVRNLAALKELKDIIHRKDLLPEKYRIKFDEARWIRLGKMLHNPGRSDFHSSAGGMT